MNPKKRMSGFIIHGFAVAHAAATALLAQTLLGDEPVLTALTIAMITAVAILNGADWSTKDALVFLGIFLGKYIGIRGLTLLVKWIPFLGNAANATVTFVTTEILGWATYAFVSKGMQNPSDLSKIERENLLQEANTLRETEGEKSKEVYDKKSASDKARFDAIMKKLKKLKISKDASDEECKRFDEESARYLQELTEIARKYETA